jgi:RNA polymerase sigma factor (sigma-70 family)
MDALRSCSCSSDGPDSGTLIGRLHRFVRRRVATKEDAEDIIQDAYLRVLRYSFEHEVADQERLLFSAARNLAVDSMRRRHARERATASYATLAEIALDWPTPDEELYVEQRLRIAESTVALLPERCREVFLLHHLDNLSYSQIAARRQISVSAVEKHMARAGLLINATIGREEQHSATSLPGYRRRSARAPNVTRQPT